MSQTSPLLILVDGSSFLFRAYHALPPLTNANGVPTGAMYGVLNMLRKLLQDYNPDYIAVVFDPKGKTFRHDMYPDYKANRPPMDEDLRVQIAPLHHIIRAMGLPLIIVDGVEADDVIGTYAKIASEQSVSTVIATSDKDMAQLVNEHVTLVNTMSDTTLDADGVLKKFGVQPERIVDYLALIGDKVDNVPGVPKVGPKTAVKWLDEYKTLDNIIENAEQFKGKVGEYLRNSVPLLPLCKDLVTIKCDVNPLPDLSALTQQAKDTAALHEYYSEYNFKTWLKQLESDEDESASANQTETPYTLIDDKAELEKWLLKIKQDKIFSFDTETNSLDPISAELVGISIALSDGSAAYIPVAHHYVGAPPQLDREATLALFKPLLEDINIKKIGQHLKYDMNVLKKYDIVMQGIAYDTLLESYVLDSTAGRHDMDSMAERYLQYQTIAFTDVAGKGAQQLTFDQVPLDKALNYAAEDAYITYRLHQVLHEKLKAEPRLQQVYDSIELPLMPILADIEYTGVLVDSAVLQQQSHALGKRLKTIEAQAYETVGHDFNLNSPKQLQEILFNQFDLPVLQKTPKGQPSTAESVLQELAKDYELPALIMSYRSLSKLKSTYTDALPTKINPLTGRVHTSYHQAVTSTGRLSSSDPNLQNIPIRTEEGRAIRQAFIAKADHKMVAADYSQIELRIMAHLSQDPGLLSAFAKGEDVHRATASEVFGVSVETVSTEQRRSAKAINFGLIYGMSAFGLAKQLGIDRQQAQAYMDCYFERYPNVKSYMDKTRAFVHDTGYVETLFGRRLNLPEIKSRNKQRVIAMERAAINGPMQGTAADLIKLAMIKLSQSLNANNLNGKMIMQVHDELVFEVPNTELDQTVALIKAQMESAGQLDVPLLVDIGIGENWDQAH